MNAQLKQMIRAGSPKDRAILAAIVQADIDRMDRERIELEDRHNLLVSQHLSLAERQHQLVKRLIAAGVTDIAGEDEVLSLEGIEDKEADHA